MEQVKLSVTLLEGFGSEHTVAAAGKVCYAEDIHEVLRDKSKDAEFISRLKELGHESPTEHASMSLLISGVSRSLTHQLVRHRISSYSQRSQRYVNEFNLKYVLPKSIEKNKFAETEFIKAIDSAEKSYAKIASLLFIEYVILAKPVLLSYGLLAADIMESDSMESLMSKYKDFKELATMNLGSSKVSALEKKAFENAREVLPNATASDIVVTMNLRGWKHFLEERLCFRAQDQIRSLAVKVSDILSAHFPHILGDVGPKCHQLGYCPEGRMCCGHYPTKQEVIGAWRESRNEGLSV